ncbi:hypothetical protein ACEWY4_018092 [Coilia grayii]|uniref:Protein MIS12 homolog n=1 Tax=Coilia grayii TaxID=363190 RepID=A0ABD1JM66_9TELE
MLRIYCAFHDGLYELMSLVESVFKRQLAPVGQEPSEDFCVKTQKCSQKLLQFLQGRFDILSERMKHHLVGNILSIPPNVLLPDSEPHRRYPKATEELMRVEKSLAELNQAFQAEVCARQALEAELGEQLEVQEHLDGILSWMAELKACSNREGFVHDDFTPVMDTVRHLQDVKTKIVKRSKELDELQ